MNISETLIFFGSYEIKSIYLIIGFSFVLWFFVLWYEALKDGFNLDRIFDIFFWSSVCFGLSYFFVNNLYLRSQIFNPTSFIIKLDKNLLLILFPYLVSLFPLFVFSKIFKWSIYRLLDIMSVANSALIMSLSIGYLLLYKEIRLIPLILFGIIFSLYISRFRGYKLMSGLIFSIFLILISVGGMIFYRPDYNLPFYLVLITIGLVNLYLRLKKSMIINKNTPTNLIKSVTDLLTKKDKELKKEEELLKQEDSFKDPERVTDNSEDLDDAILEDGQKELTDLKIMSIANMRLQIKKALALIKIGKYGVCEVCGENIDPARLKIYPEATKCFKCASKEG